MTEKPFVFVLMPFASSFDDVYNLGIKDTVERAGMFAERVDEQVYHHEQILERIYNQIDIADVIVADMTGRNANVFYEVGYAHAKNKLCILLTQSADDIPFDLRHRRHIVYSSVRDLKMKIAHDLTSVEHELARREQPLKIELRRIDGDLEKSKYYATALVTISLDIHNKTDVTSPDINGIYFYTGSNWTFSQEGQDCSASPSDLKEYSVRHFLRSPTPRINKQGWVPLSIKGRKVVATAFKGETLDDSYNLTGFALVRVRTNNGDFDSRIDLKVTADDIPF